MSNLSDYIEINRDIAGGSPVFKGTRVTVKTRFDYLEDESLEEFLSGFPTVPRKHAEIVIEMAAEKLLYEIPS